MAFWPYLYNQQGTTSVVIPPIEYDFRVRAINSVGSGPWSEVSESVEQSNPPPEF